MCNYTDNKNVNKIFIAWECTKIYKKNFLFVTFCESRDSNGQTSNASMQFYLMKQMKKTHYLNITIICETTLCFLDILRLKQRNGGKGERIPYIKLRF